MIRNVLIAILAGLAVTACHTSFGHRDEVCGPDQRLDALLDQHDRAKRGASDALSDDHLTYDCDRVRNAIERLALEYPRHQRILLANGALAYEAREPEKAANYLDRLLGVQPASPDGAVLRSRIAIEEGNLPLAKRTLTRQIEYRPDHAGLREALASVSYLERDLEGARAQLALAERLDAPEWRIAYHRGLIAEAAGDAAGAQREYQRCVDANPAFAPASARLEGSRALSGYNAGSSSGKTGGG